MEILFKDYHIYIIKLLYILLASALQLECTSVPTNQIVEQFELHTLIGYITDGRKLSVIGHIVVPVIRSIGHCPQIWLKCWVGTCAVGGSSRVLFHSGMADCPARLIWRNIIHLYIASPVSMSTRSIFALITTLVKTHMYIIITHEGLLHLRFSIACGLLQNIYCKQSTIRGREGLRKRLTIYR